MLCLSVDILIILFLVILYHISPWKDPDKNYWTRSTDVCTNVVGQQPDGQGQHRRQCLNCLIFFSFLPLRLRRFFHLNAAGAMVKPMASMTQNPGTRQDRNCETEISPCPSTDQRDLCSSCQARRLATHHHRKFCSQAIEYRKLWQVLGCGYLWANLVLVSSIASKNN